MEYIIDNRVILIDNDDLDFISRLKWKIYILGKTESEYVASASGFMHRLIMRANRGEYVDHINGNTLDNRKENLRIVSQGINIANAKMFSHNTSGYRGVIWFRNGWRAQIKYCQKIVQSPQFKNPEDAAILRDEIARQLFGNKVYLNFPNIQPKEQTIQEASRLINLLKARI